jgi:hypothetical protein
MNIRNTLGRVAAIAVAAGMGGLSLSGVASASTAQPGATAGMSQSASLARPDLTTPNTCAIQSNNGDFLSAVDGGGRTTDVIRTNATRISTWERFTFVNAGGVHVGIKTANGHYLTAIDGGGRNTDVIHSDATHLQAWEEFTLVPEGNQVYGIETINGHFLTSVDDGGRATDAIHSDATQIRGWELFWMICGV